MTNKQQENLYHNLQNYWRRCNISQKSAIILYLAIVIVSILYIIPSIIEINAQNGILQHERIFNISFNYNFNNSIAQRGMPDLIIDLQVRYPHGTLIVDDPVDIQGTAISYSNSVLITNVTIAFPGSRRTPSSNPSSNLPFGTEIRMNAIKNTNILKGPKTTVIWNLEGTDSPEIAITYLDKNGFHDQFGYSNDTILTIYPKSQLAQIVTNKASIAFAIAAYFLGLLGTCILIYDLLWKRKN